MKPIDRFDIDLNRIRFLTLSKNSDELFHAQATRQVKNSDVLFDSSTSIPLALTKQTHGSAREQYQGKVPY